MFDAVVRALGMAFAMGWEILWPLIVGFALSGVVQAVVSHKEMSRLLPDDGPRSIATALALGAASSSCSYAGLIPREHKARVVETSITWNYTTWLNIAFLSLAALLVWRFATTGGGHMLRMMNRPPHDHSHAT